MVESSMLRSLLVVYAKCRSLLLMLVGVLSVASLYMAMVHTDIILGPPKVGLLQDLGGQFQNQLGQLQDQGGQLQDQGGQLQDQGGQLQDQGGQLQDLVSTNTFMEIIKKDLFNLSRSELSVFMAVKEEQYQERREKVERICRTVRKKSPEFGTRFRNHSLIYDSEDGAAYCQIAKVASSTWCQHFIDLANPPQKVMNRWKNALQMFAPRLWPPPPHLELKEKWDETTSLVIVRHPMARLASVYYQKMIGLYDHKGWSKLIRYMIRQYRPDRKSGDQRFPTPTEFLRYILDDLLYFPNKVDQHWKPQHQACPFCVLNFTVYSHQEELDQDSAYFLLAGNLTGKLNPLKLDLQLNKLSSPGVKQAKFWKDVDSKYLEQLEQPWAYLYDLQMFGYSVQEYLQSLPKL